MNVLSCSERKLRSTDPTRFKVLSRFRIASVVNVKDVVPCRVKSNVLKMLVMKFRFAEP